MGLLRSVVDELNPDNIFYCTGYDGIFYTTDAGEHWYNLDGPYDVRTVDIIPFSDEGKVYIATNGDGVWFGEDIQFGVEDNGSPLVVKNSLLKNYPNPFSSLSGRIWSKNNYCLQHKKESTIELSIYNIKGELVKTLYKGKHKKEIFPNMGWEK